MNRYMPSEVKNLTRNKEKVMQRVVLQLEQSPKKGRSSWQYSIFTCILTAIVFMFLASQFTNSSKHVASENKEAVHELLELKKNETIIVQDHLEFTVQDSKIDRKIKPSKAGPISETLENGVKGQVFLDTVISVKNLLGKEISEADEFLNVKIIYDDKYEYNSFTSFERVGEVRFSSLNTSIIEPMQTRVIHFLASVPTHIEEDDKSLKAIITVNEDKYELIIR